ncbi:RNA-binding protein YlmH [Hydrogenoanaerobacterium saccharovorans]|uniref:RNA-binding protein YlmH, contains S4-like domain n=1 Tax=Hydrogenoanaerobacterium saccharovorans TaxID=474960 RepID=A0A1H7ZJJ8_9FIRM|nr:YlmH/Sll1252 family protein [Hydrogenoanaerobacterium saccharovorans]RPF48561.1 RNA-binding protein YlmH [Hydrogenoanaerobacterium saccharovorans]SEM58453.1 RNA-binding protein YlmH, contains S4-like domain [Hydrogenoanaerobacterium saccharovorans]
MNLSNLSQQEKYFLAKVSDAFQAADTKSYVRMIGFLDERQQIMANTIALQQHRNNFILFGGYNNANRKILGIFPNYIDLTQEPNSLFDNIDSITFRYRSEDVLSHRDFLGALMNLNITRESIGDILVGKGITVLFVMHTVTQIILDELFKVGRVGVQLEVGMPDVLPLEEHFFEIKDTVSSLRLDCIVSTLTKLSREKSTNLIEQGLVTQNYECIQNNSHPVCEGDIISIRGYGKFIVAQSGAVTKKGRIHVLCKKYL